jgi:electron transport complex protein RnfE
MCPSLAVTTSAINGLGMGIAMSFVLFFSNLTISLLRHLIPSGVRIPSFIVIIASFVTMVDLFMEGFFFDLHRALGVFVPLIVVNCIILGRAEAFASRNQVSDSLVDALGMGLGYTIFLVILGSIREIIGMGTIFGVTVFGEGYLPFIVMILPPGAFISLGLLLGIMNKIEAMGK